MSRQSGFSIIEIIIAIAIVGILALTFVPKMEDALVAIRLRAAAEKMIDDIRYISSYAIANHDTTWLVVDTANNRYGIYEGPTAGSRTLLHDPSTNKAAQFEFQTHFPGVSITGADFDGDAEMSIDWWGTPSAGGTVTLNSSKVITIEPGTGYVYEN